MKKTPLLRGHPIHRGANGLRRDTPIKRKPRTKSERRRIYGTDEHQAWLRAHGCLGCARVSTEERPHHLHHTKNGGLSKKAAARWQVPLCYPCHQFLHDEGPQTFEQAYSAMLCGRTLRSWAETFAHAWEKWQGLTPIGDIVPGVVADIINQHEDSSCEP